MKDHAVEPIYVLLEDISGTLHSVPEPIGKAVTDQDEARAWMERGGSSWRRSYAAVTVHDKAPED